MKRDYDSTVARIAGNLLSGMDHTLSHEQDLKAAQWAVEMARAIVAEVKRTAPAEKEQ